jgi:hypothetical protein
MSNAISLPPAGAAANGPGNPSDCAIVVGVGRYPSLGDLGGPVNDAQAFIGWLTDPAGGRLDGARVRQILSPGDTSPGVVHPLREEVLDAFDWLDKLAADSDEQGHGLRAGRRLYLYFAGHGFSPQENQTALLMANATRQRVGYHVAGPAYADWFYHAGYFDEILLFMDCCREALPLAPLMPAHYLPIDSSRVVDRARLFYAYGTRWSRLSRERPMPPNNVVRGVFTTALLAGLRGEAADAAGRITSLSLNSYLFQNMRRFLAPADLVVPSVPKEPDIYVYPTPTDDWVLAEGLRPPSATARITPTGPATGVQLLDGRFQPTAPAQAGPPSWTFVVAPGLYLARGIAANGLPTVERPLTLQAGENPDVQL